MTVPNPAYCSVFMAISQDGFIAGPDGELDWLDQANRRVPPGEDCGFGDFIARVDALVMGRKTFETVRALGTWPYGDKPVVVLSRSLKHLPRETPFTVQLSFGQPREVVDKLCKLGMYRLYIDGGNTVQTFMQAGLIRESVLTEVPCTLERGIALWSGCSLPAGFALQHQRTYPFGFVQRHYLFNPLEQDRQVRKVPS